MESSFEKIAERATVLDYVVSTALLVVAVTLTIIYGVERALLWYVLAAVGYGMAYLQPFKRIVQRLQQTVIRRHPLRIQPNGIQRRKRKGTRK